MTFELAFALALVAVLTLLSVMVYLDDFLDLDDEWRTLSREQQRQQQEEQGDPMLIPSWIRRLTTDVRRTWQERGRRKL